MSIPLVQNNEKDSINTSIIAIKRNIERINMLLGLVDNDSPDLSGFATKQELQDAVTELQPTDEVTVGNMHSVSSNAVARALSWSTQEIDTGTTFTDNNGVTKKVYKKNIWVSIPDNGQYNIPLGVPNANVIHWTGSLYSPNYENQVIVFHIPFSYLNELSSTGSWISIYCYYDKSRGEFITSYLGNNAYTSYFANTTACFFVEYTK